MFSQSNCLKSIKITKLSMTSAVALCSIMSAGILTNNTYAVDYSASITTSGAQSINVSPGADGNAGTSISADEINVTTTCKAGYNLTLSTSVNDNNLYLNGDSANNASGTYFTPANGSNTLAESPNTWGYFVSDSTGGGDAVPTGTSTFSAVPVVGSPATIKTPLATPSETDINDTFNVYYGVAVSNNMTLGKYKMIPDTNNSNADGTIVYRLTMADACISYTVAYNPTSSFEGNTLTGTGTVGNQTIMEGVATNLTSSRFTAPSGYYFAGWNTEPDGTGTTYSSGQSVTDIANVGETLTLYAMWTDCPALKICYNKNIASAVGTMGNQSASSDVNVTLLASNFSSGDPTNATSPGDYGFIGWSPVKLDPDDAEFRTKLANLVANNNIYGPNETINTGILNYGGKKLYAVWVPVARDENDTELALQAENLLTTNLADTTDGSTLNDKPNGYVTALRDARDHQVYAVAKLADGKYWMIENLRLEAENTVGNNRFDSSVTNQSLAQGYGTSTTYGNFSGLANAESADFSNSTTANSLYYSGTQSGTASINIGTTNSPGYRMPRYNNTNTSARANSPTSGSNSIYSYGNYYTWSAAMANTIYYNSATATDADGKTSETVNTSLCPTGWRLPYGRDTGNGTMAGGFYNLNYKINNDSNVTDSTASQKPRAYPNNFLYSGGFSTSSAGNRGSGGYYWSSTAYGSLNSYYFDLNSSGVYSGTTYSGKYVGQSIRCVAGS